MKEIWEQAILSYNLPLTILLGLIMVYWLLSAFGAVDADTFDVDFDADVDIDLDADAHGDHHSGSFFGGIMKFVNAQDVPLMVILSLLTLFMWTISIFANYYFNPNQSDLLALGYLAGNFITSVLLVKVVTQPLRPLMRAIKNDTDAPPPVVGSVGIVKSRLLDQHFGQVEVIRDKGAPALLNCKLREGEEGQMRGSEVLIYDFDKENDRYLVRSLTHKEQKDNISQSLTTQQITKTTTTITNNETPIKQ